MSKSAVHRHKQALEGRNRHPESWLWETDEGYRWLIIFVCATIYIFGIQGGIGMNTIARFFILVRLDKHIGVSPTSLYCVVSRIEELILAYNDKNEHAKDGLIQVIVGADETFFEKVILVLMDLSSGYIVLEEPAEDRSFSTWKDKGLQALQRLGLEAGYMVSDNAKALAKLALEGLGCRRIPDLFHACHEVVKLLGTRFASKAARIQRKLSKALVTLDLFKELNKSPEKIEAQEQLVAQLRIEQNRILDGQRRYYDSLHELSKILHPFCLLQHTSQNSKEAEEDLNQVLDMLQALSEEYGIKDSKNRIEKVRKQIPELAQVIDLWWLWVKESLAGSPLPKQLESWLLEYLLPLCYWQAQVLHTSSKELRKTYKKAYQQAQEHLQSHQLTSVLHPKEFTRWQSWAKWIVTKFQRSSSAVEGRNGVLSRMNHTQRSIPLRRLNVLTVVHNFGIHREDGTTAAQRLFGEEFPDLFDWIVEHIGDLPLPRERPATS